MNISEYNGQIPSMLVPVRTFCTTSDVKLHIRATKWIALNPLQFLELLAAMTGEAERMESKGQLRLHTRIGPCNFSSKTIPFSKADAPQNLIVTEPHEFLPACLFLPELDDCEDRTLTPPLMFISRTQTSIMVIRPVIRSSPRCIQPWDLSHLMYHDTEGLVYLEAIQSLAEYLENRLDVNVVDPYQSLRRDFGDQVEFVTHHANGLTFTLRRRILFKVYQQAIEKMNALVSLLQRFEMVLITATLNVTPYMTRWLVLNWTNPYPDDKNLDELAMSCNTTIQVISTWLINARTRKWRSAIQEAYQMGRPAQFLREDSLKIFEEADFRRIPDFQPIPTSKRSICKTQTTTRARVFAVRQPDNFGFPSHVVEADHFQDHFKSLHQNQYPPGSALVNEFVPELMNAGRGLNLMESNLGEIIQL